RQVQAGDAVAGEVHHMATIFQIVTDIGRDVAVVFDHQYAHALLHGVTGGTGRPSRKLNICGTDNSRSAGSGLNDCIRENSPKKKPGCAGWSPPHPGSGLVPLPPSTVVEPHGTLRANRQRNRL